MNVTDSPYSAPAYLKPTPQIGLATRWLGVEAAS
jgi:hypothetical protein